MTDLENMLVYAARYAHGRRTGAALQVVSCIIRNWDYISEPIQQQLCSEAANEAQYCLQDWKPLVERLKQ